MSRITVDNVATAIRKVRSMSIREKGALAEEIHRRQLHMLASCLVQSKLGVEPTCVEFLLNTCLCATSLCRSPVCTPPALCQSPDALVTQPYQDSR